MKSLFFSTIIVISQLTNFAFGFEVGDKVLIQKEMEIHNGHKVEYKKLRSIRKKFNNSELYLLKGERETVFNESELALYESTGELTIDLDSVAISESLLSLFRQNNITLSRGQDVLYSLTNSSVWNRTSFKSSYIQDITKDGYIKLYDTGKSKYFHYLTVIKDLIKNQNSIKINSEVYEVGETVLFDTSDYLDSTIGEALLVPLFVNMQTFKRCKIQRIISNKYMETSCSRGFVFIAEERIAKLEVDYVSGEGILAQDCEHHLNGNKRPIVIESRNAVNGFLRVSGAKCVSSNEFISPSRFKHIEF